MRFRSIWRCCHNWDTCAYSPQPSPWLRWLHCLETFSSYEATLSNFVSSFNDHLVEGFPTLELGKYVNASFNVISKGEGWKRILLENFNIRIFFLKIRYYIFFSFFFQNAMEAMGLVAILVNCALIGLSGQVQRMFPEMSATQTILLIVALEHIMLGIRFIIICAIPDIPHWVATEMAKVEFLRREAVRRLSSTPSPEQHPATVIGK